MSTRPASTRLAGGSVELTFPFCRELIDALKVRIPGHARRYDPDEHTWKVAAAYAEIAESILFARFPDARVTGDAGHGAADAPKPRSTATPHTAPESFLVANETLIETGHYRCPKCGANRLRFHSGNAIADCPGCGGECFTEQLVGSLSGREVRVSP